MILLDNSKSLDVLVNDKTNGLGRLQPISATVNEELNGVYELNFTISTDDKHFNDLVNGGLVKCNAGEFEGEQIFRIQRISKPINSIVSVYCRHISYDLGKVLVKPFSSTGSINTVQSLLNNVVGEYPFTMTTDIVNTESTFSLAIPKTFRECLGGWEGSILDVFRTEYEFDNLTVKMLARRGSDTDVRIAYGKNLTDLNQDESIENVYDGCVGYVTQSENTIMGDIQLINEVSQPRILIVDFSNQFDYDTTPTKAQINEMAMNYATENAINEPTVNLSVSFVPLWQTEEYKNVAPLERVGLGDKIKVDFPKLKVSANAKVVSRKWNVLLERYESIELGSVRSNLTTAINNTFNSLNQANTEAQSFIEAEMNQLASLIINGLGLHKTLVEVDGGGYQYYLHNKPTLAESDTQYIFTSEGFLVSTDYGQTFNAGFDSEGNVVVNSLSTVILRALDIYGSRITFGDINDKYIRAEQYVLNNKNVGISFDGNGYARFQPTEMFQVLNQSDTSNLYNKLILERFGSNQSHIQLQNIDYQTQGVANSMDLNTDHNGKVNYASIFNRNTFGSTPYFSNAIEFETNEENNKTTLSNYKYNSNQKAGSIELMSNDYNNRLTMNNYVVGSNNVVLNKLEMSSTETSGYYETAQYSSDGNYLNNIRQTYNSNTGSTIMIGSDWGGTSQSWQPRTLVYLNEEGEIVIQARKNVIVQGKKLVFDSSGYVKWTN